MPVVREADSYAMKGAGGGQGPQAGACAWAVPASSSRPNSISRFIDPPWLWSSVLLSLGRVQEGVQFQLHLFTPSRNVEETRDVECLSQFPQRRLELLDAPIANIQYIQGLPE